MPTWPADETVQRLAVDILAAPPFTEEPEVAQLFWTELWETLANLFQRYATDLSAREPLLFWGLVILSALLVVHTARLLWKVLPHRSVRRATAAASDQPDAAAFRPGLDPAYEALAGGNPRHAIELAWQATVAASSRSAGAIDATPRAQARLLAQALGPTTSEALAALLRAHEHACYSGRPTEAALATSALAAAQIVLTQVRS